ncbi:hypothetical protein B9Z65_8277 [Elsinoe australis]|uniref:Domain of unknown function at the cortex 1 domain-containing protein n=1 Tax=Elsinoe australis TaxID=40998 RepID=A0A2P7YDA3_9PEZI|nr:hypothetical protein B9Z65_8277 [Elsinoe australis]
MASMIKDAVSSATGHSSSSSTEKANTDSEGHDKTKNFRLRITAGPTYDKSLQRVLAVNSPEAHPVSENVAVSLRIRDYDGLPSTSPVNVPEYFELPEHSKDTFSVAWAFTPPHDMPASNLYFGIDTGHNPIRKFGISKSLINTAFKIVKEFIDPSLSCDAGVDEPFVRGPAVAGATTTLCVGDRQGPAESEAPPTGANGVPPTGSEQQAPAHLSPNPDAASPPSRSSPPTSSPSSRKSSASTPVDLSGLVFPDPQLLTEGATSPEAQAHRKSAGLPSDPAKRRKHLNSESHRKEFILQKGRTYYFDFSNGYIDWKSYALKLPGFSVPVLKYLGGGKPPPSPGSSPQVGVERNGSAGSVESEAQSAQGQASAPPSPEGKKGGSGSHKVRFFLRDIASEEVYFVIMCTLLTGADLTQALEEDRAVNGGS